MLPVHRTMKNGQRDFYSDDKYDKIHNNSNHKVKKITIIRMKIIRKFVMIQNFINIITYSL